MDVHGYTHMVPDSLGSRYWRKYVGWVDTMATCAYSIIQ